MLVDLGPATVGGALFAVTDPQGWYPILLPGAGTIRGRLYAARPLFDDTALARLDTYEDFDPADPEGSLFVRTAMTVTNADDMRCEAQAYLFNLPLPADARPIPDGDFHAWIAREGLRPYGAVS